MVLDSLPPSNLIKRLARDKMLEQFFRVYTYHSLGSPSIKIQLCLYLLTLVVTGHVDTFGFGLTFSPKLDSPGAGLWLSQDADPLLTEGPGPNPRASPVAHSHTSTHHSAGPWAVLSCLSLHWGTARRSSFSAQSLGGPQCLEGVNMESQPSLAVNCDCVGLFFFFFFFSRGLSPFLCLWGPPLRD